jgi:hypothetical protein
MISARLEEALGKSGGGQEMRRCGGLGSGGPEDRAAGGDGKGAHVIRVDAERPLAAASDWVGSTIPAERAAGLGVARLGEPEVLSGLLLARRPTFVTLRAVDLRGELPSVFSSTSGLARTSIFESFSAWSPPSSRAAKRDPIGEVRL